MKSMIKEYDPAERVKETQESRDQDIDFARAIKRA